MKFKSNTDEIQYKMLGLNEVEVRKRLSLVKKSVDRKKSREMKNNWRRNKNKMLKGIKKWKKSTDGKRFHRALGRFNALRETSIQYYYDELNPSSKKVALTMSQVNDALLGLSSIETHLYLELQYYEADPEAMSQFLDILRDFISDSSYLKIELLSSFITGELDNEDYLLLTDIIQFFQDPKMYVYAKRDLRGESNDTKNEDFIKQVNLAENIDISLSGNEIYEQIDKLFE